MQNVKLFVLMATAIVLSSAGTLQTWAESKYALKEMTPAVEAALEHRRSRYDQLQGLKSSGVVGEDNRGYVDALVDDPIAKDVAGAENKDRAVIYTTIAEQNGLTDALATIEKVFAHVQRDKAQAGEKIQDDNGQWTTK
jgi:uncharacterized protein YdbL (DUF1318 family)